MASDTTGMPPLRSNFPQQKALDGVVTLRPHLETPPPPPEPKKKGGQPAPPPPAVPAGRYDLKLHITFARKARQKGENVRFLLQVREAKLELRGHEDGDYRTVPGSELKPAVATFVTVTGSAKSGQETDLAGGATAEASVGVWQGLKAKISATFKASHSRKLKSGNESRVEKEAAYAIAAQLGVADGALVWDLTSLVPGQHLSGDVDALHTGPVLQVQQRTGKLDDPEYSTLSFACYADRGKIDILEIEYLKDGKWIRAGGNKPQHIRAAEAFIRHELGLIAGHPGEDIDRLQPLCLGFALAKHQLPQGDAG